MKKQELITKTVANTITVKELAERASVFEFDQRVAMVYSKSNIVPKEFQNNVADCYVIINLARQLGVPEMMAFQNIYVIQGKPSFSAQFWIAQFNSCGQYTSINYDFTGEVSDGTRACIAYATEKLTGKLIMGPEVSMITAKQEGWSTKSGSKWKTMPELMLRYRAATFLCRTVAPQLTMGLHSTEENKEIATNEVKTKSVKTQDETVSLAKVVEEVVKDDPTPQLVIAPETKMVRDNDLF